MVMEVSVGKVRVSCNPDPARSSSSPSRSTAHPETVCVSSRHFGSSNGHAARTFTLVLRVTGRCSTMAGSNASTNMLGTTQELAQRADPNSRVQQAMCNGSISDTGVA